MVVVVMSRLLPPGHLHAEGSRIVDSGGETVRLAGVNWYGSRACRWWQVGWT